MPDPPIIPTWTPPWDYDQGLAIVAGAWKPASEWQLIEQICREEAGKVYSGLADLDEDTANNSAAGVYGILVAAFARYGAERPTTSIVKGTH